MDRITSHIDKEFLDFLDSKVDKSQSRQVISNAIKTNGIDKVAQNTYAVNEMNLDFSLNLETSPITSQNRSGRCWLFAALNTLRQSVIKKLNLENFEFSQNYLMFWDKLEKSNYMLEAIIETREQDLNSRLVNWLLKEPVQDGGQWDMYVSLIKKYGIVPKTAMPETKVSSETMRLNYLLTFKLRQGAALLRRLCESGCDDKMIYKKKNKILSDIYNMLVYSLGEPPKEFVFEHTNKDKDYFNEGRFTPHEFAEKYVLADLEEYVSVINAPTTSKKFNQTYTVKYLGNVKEGNSIKYLNLEIEELKNLAIKQLEDSESVWFGCDVDKMFDREKGVLHHDLYDFNETLATCLDLDKGKRLDYGISQMTHAMVFAGVNLVDGKPTKWKVENSWGEKVGKKGMFIMNDKWFDDHTYQVVINKKYLNKEQLKAWDTKPIELEPWDPMGSLA